MLLDDNIETPFKEQYHFTHFILNLFIISCLFGRRVLNII